MTSRLLSTLLTVPLLLGGLAACTDDDAKGPAAAPAPTATGSPLPPAPSGAITRSPAGDSTGDAEICRQADAAKKKFATAFAAGDTVPPAATRKAFNDLATALDTLGRSGERSSDVAAGARAVSVELTRIADEPDPAALSGDPELEKAGQAFDTACADR